MDEYKTLSDETLYKHINSAEIRQETLKKHQLFQKSGGVESLKLDPLVAEVRRRCEQNLWFLGKYFLWDTDVAGAENWSIGVDTSKNFFVEHVHRRVCDMFVTKDKTKPIGQQDWRKDRLILYPRFTGKSAWDRYDVVQWILNFPEIRILYLTATQPLADGFVGETKGHFVRHRDDEASLMNLYFPEFCAEPDDLGTAAELICPNAVWVKRQLKRKEPTVRGGGMETTLSGGHYEVIKADDTVSDENSGTDVACKKITSGYNLKHKMLLPTGYADKIGTRYADEDLYGEELKKNVGTNIARQTGDNWEIIDNNDLGLRILIGRSIVIKSDVRDRLEKENKPITYQEAGKDGCTLLFPEHHPYSWCLREYAANEVIFEGQQNQNPRSSVDPTFSKALLLRHTIPWNDPVIPQLGPVSQFWDFAYSKAKGRDYSTGSAVIWNAKGQMTVIDLIRAKFKPLELAKAVVEFAVKHRPYIIGVEKSLGADFLQQSIDTEAAKTKNQQIIDVCRKIDWVKPSTQLDAKKNRMRSLHPWIAGDMMYFRNDIPHLDTLYDEFERCLATGLTHDDIPDNLGYQPRYALPMNRAIVAQEVERFSRPDSSWAGIFDSSGELYGSQSSQYMPSPFQGLLLKQDIQDDGTISINWVSEHIQNPIVQIQPAEEPRPRGAYDDMPNILGVL